MTARGKREYKQGVVIGPHDGDIDAIMSAIPDEIRESVVEVKPFDVFVTVEVGTYDESKAFANLNGAISHNNHPVFFALTDVIRFHDFGAAIWERIGEFWENETFNFVDWPTRFKINWKSPQHLSTSLLLASSYSMLNGKPIKHLNFVCSSGPNFMNLHGLRDWRVFFPDLTGVSFSGCDLGDFEKMKGILGDLPVTIDQPGSHMTGTTECPTVGIYDMIPPEHFYDPWVMEGAVCPQFTMQYEETEDLPEPTLSMFPVMQVDTSASVLHAFICHYFESMGTDIEYTTHLYAECSVFSLSIDPTSNDPTILEYRNVAANCKIGQYTRLIGRENITQGMRVLFPNGFRAAPERMEYCELIPNMFGVFIYGVFEHSRGGTLGFRKSLTVGYDGGVVQIMNEHMHVHSV